MDVTDERVAAVARQLIADSLVLPIDGRLLGLPVPGALPPLPDHRAFPGGYVEEWNNVRQAANTA